jgi:branched-chain amino acid aminotransferase
MAKPRFDPNARSLTYIDGKWQEGNVPLMGSMTHAAWLGSVVFDGARAFEGVAPDLDRHAQRTVDSAIALGLRPMLTAPEITELAWDGIGRFEPGTALYIRPMFFAETGFVAPDPESTRFALVIWESPMPEPKGFSCTLSRFRRPPPDMAVSQAKAACHYPNLARALVEARDKGFDNAVVLDPIGNVAEFATSNIMFAKDGVVHTPVLNGTYLAGITRRRVLSLLRGAGVEVQERAVRYEEVTQADEVFSTGNYGKVQPVTRIEDQHLQPGPFFQRARELYWEFAHGG